MKTQRILIKIGTNVLHQSNGKLDYKLITELAAQIAKIRSKGHEVLVVSSGSVGAGRELFSVDESKNTLASHQILASVGQARLIQIYADAFREHKITVAQILLTRGDFGLRKSYLNIRNTLENLLKYKIVPIVNENDVVATEELDLNFGDNDLLAVYLATLIGADQLFFLTVAPGLLKEEATAEGKRSIVVEKVEELTDEILQHCLPVTSAGGKGGMESKVRSAGMAMSFGIDTYIIDGKSPVGVYDIMEGHTRGTHFVAHGRKIRSYQKWLAAGALNKGTLFIDAGAEQALLKNKKSLLAQGIYRVDGQFEVKDLVEICNPEGVRLGVGRADCTAKELRHHIKENKLTKNAGKGVLRKPVIHRNHLFLE
ncbi:MAG TPA: glutamate 5-kinase [Candidatus Lambdaproteobacteria bacterium]|nr:glutamate 5-kinase [Deltaproteobacteria bacterium]HHZ79293.1 glutamate 5-kinase [Candidatus Lambdaproteobacteria bacterium]HIO11536.1 glutamate 5-kinase [Deltaproteobacteria bacterium]HIO60702.1 glutamate 5-kinase [Deltaproteobacteria bacterium]